MKDKKRKYNLSYFMKYGGSPIPSESEISEAERLRRLYNLNEELEEAEKKREEEREREAAEREEQEISQILRQSGVSPGEFENFVLKTSTRAATAATVSTSTTSKVPSKNAPSAAPKNYKSKEEFVSLAKSELRSMHKSDREVEKQQERSKARMEKIRSEKDEERTQHLEVIATIMANPGLRDNDLILFKDFYCSDPKKHNDLFVNFFENKFNNYFREIDSLRGDERIIDSIRDESIEILANAKSSSLNSSKLISNLIKFAQIFKPGTDFDIASNSLFTKIHDDLNKLDKLSEMNLKDLQKVLEYLYIVQEWIRVTYGEKLEIKVDSSKLTSDKLQEYLNKLLNMLGEKQAELSEYNFKKFSDFIKKRVVRLLLDYAADKLIGLLLDKKNTRLFTKRIEKLIEYGLLSGEELDEIFEITKNIENREQTEQTEQTEQKGLTTENIVKQKYLKQTKNEEDRKKIVTILGQPQAKIDLMIGHLLNYFKSKPQSGGKNDDEEEFTLPKEQERQIKRQRKKKIKDIIEEQRKLKNTRIKMFLNNKENKPVVLANANVKINGKTKNREQGISPISIPKGPSFRNRAVSAQIKRIEKPKIKVANSTATATANAENWEKGISPISIPKQPNQSKGPSWRNHIQSAQIKRIENEKKKKEIQKIEELKEKSLKDAEIKLSKNRVQSYLNSKGNERYLANAKKFLLNPKGPKAWKVLSFPNRPNANSNNNSRHKLMNINNNQIIKRNNSFYDPNKEHKFATILKIIEQIKAKKLLKQKKIEELLKRLNTEKRQDKINKIAIRINKLTKELKNQEEEEEEEEENNRKNNRENNFVLMISPTQRLSDLTVTISGKKIKIENIMNIYKEINNLFGQIFIQEAYIDRINNLKNSIFDKITSNGSFKFENDISMIILNLLNEHGYGNLFIDQLLGVNDVNKLIKEIIEILKNNLCNILDEEEYHADEYYIEQIERIKQKLRAQQLPPLLIAYQSEQSNEKVTKTSLQKYFNRIENSQAQGNLHARPSSQGSNSSSANSEASKALTVTSRKNSLFFKPELKPITKNEKNRIKEEILREQEAIAINKNKNQSNQLEEIITEIKKNISDMVLESGKIPTKLMESITKRIQRLSGTEFKELTTILNKKLRKLEKEAAAKAAAKAEKAAANAAAKASSKKPKKVSSKNK